MLRALIATNVQPAAATTPRRAVLRLLALAAGSIVVPLISSDTLAHEKNKHHKDRLDGVDAGFTQQRTDSARDGLNSRWQLWDDIINVTGDDRAH